MLAIRYGLSSPLFLPNCHYLDSQTLILQNHYGYQAVHLNAIENEARNHFFLNQYFFPFFIPFLRIFSVVL